MPTLLIRDDDVGFFTHVEQFRRVHRVLLENRIPFNAAVIPCARANVRSASGGHEGFIPARFQGQNRSFPVSENQALVAFLKEHPFIEITQHGFSHEKTNCGAPEFAGENLAELVSKLENGSKILTDTFGKAAPFFVPPYDTVSKPALEVIRKRYKGISLSRISHHLLPMRLWPKHQFLKKTDRYLINWNGFSIVQHPGLDFSFHGVSDDCMKKYLAIKDFFVLPVHSWNFFTPEGRLKTNLLKVWENALQKLMHDWSVRFIRFSEIKTCREAM